MRVLVFGATGALGRPLVDASVAAGHDVVGTSRSASGVAGIAARGARGVQLDALDPAAVRAAVRECAPEVIVNELTGMPQDPSAILDVLADDVRVRREGHRNLLAAARETGVRRLVAQTMAFMLDGGGAPAPDDAPHRSDVPAPTSDYVEVWNEVERSCAAQDDVETVVLRYGFIYGPGTWYAEDGAATAAARAGSFPLRGEGRGVWSFVHVEDAAAAAVAAFDAPPGTYQLVDDDPTPAATWIPAFARACGGPPPLREPEEEFTQSSLDGARNDRAREVLGFRPRRLEWL